MIVTVRGRLLALGAEDVVIEADGRGYHVWVPRGVLQDLGPVGDEVRLHTTLLKRADALLLYGFGTPEERAFFELLLTVNGVGPRLALQLLSVLAVEQLQRAIANEHAAILAQVPGVGKRTAARVILELKGKVQPGVGAPAPVVTSALPSLDQELQEVLESLGYTPAEAQGAVAGLPADAPTDLEERLRLALRSFGGG
ncbi:MAG TPA: Holliday junction branch migration protein RuvA [Herpetosiphonaceae bacterium]|jgi:holliday junction DNA helicase RuvA|nr:Holliday junction branch migration protein RuvA [Herpetosiphonaceae bacterium]